MIARFVCYYESVKFGNKFGFSYNNKFRNCFFAIYFSWCGIKIKNIFLKKLIHLLFFFKSKFDNSTCCMLNITFLTHGQKKILKNVKWLPLVFAFM